MNYVKVWEFHPGTVFKKYRFCPQCGEKLARKKTVRTVTKADEDYYKYYPRRMGKTTIVVGDTEMKVTETQYYCSACNKTFTYDELRDAVKANKQKK